MAQSKRFVLLRR